MPPPLISLEDHYVSRTLQDSKYAATLGLDLFPPAVSRRLLDLDTERIREMDDANIAIQVVSHNPGAGALPLEMCRQANDQLYKEGCCRQTGRLAALAALPMTSPTQAAEELSRCVNELKFVGALISNHAEGHFFDEESYWPVFQTAQDLDVPIYLHPTFPDKSRSGFFQGNFSNTAAEAMSAYAWGWHSDVGLHFLRLFAAGLFDRFPRLKIILGHNGEMVPFMIDRIQRFCPHWSDRQRPMEIVWAENVWFTTSGMFSLAPLACLLRTAKVEKIMFSVDYPFESNKQASNFMDEVRDSGMLTPDEVEMVAYRNAEKLLRIKIGNDSLG